MSLMESWHPSFYSISIHVILELEIYMSPVSTLVQTLGTLRYNFV
uniref:Uncharacterized protein n=1 Tax=Arundo donax TaxID=35708 RepID=A0A0A8YHR8_ARUDO